MERDGNGWVECDQGHRHWGLHGAAGLLLHHVDAEGTLRVLLQHRAEWCHHGDTWGLPGGARDSHETVAEAALREAAEETAIDTTQVRVRHTFVDDHGGWSYTTVYGDTVTQLETVPNEESFDLSWLPVAEVASVPLHPGFGHTWPQVQLRPLTLVVDAANVVGSVPDGWWHDRAGAATRLASKLVELLSTTIPLDADSTANSDPYAAGVVASIHLVVEGKANRAEIDDRLHAVRAPASGDDTIVEVVAAVRDEHLIVVTSDRGLRERVRDVAPSAEIRGARWLTSHIEDH